MKPRISMITLGVRDVETAARFYEQGLGLPRRPSPPEVAFFPLDGTWLALWGRADLAQDAAVKDDGAGFGACALAHNVGSPEEVDALIAQAVQAGATTTKPGQKTSWGGYAGYFRDPDGHLWEIAHNPFMQVGPQDE